MKSERIADFQTKKKLEKKLKKSLKTAGDLVIVTPSSFSF